MALGAVRHIVSDVRGRMGICSSCGPVSVRFRTDTKKWRCQTSERYNDRKRKYGLNKEDYDLLFESQNGQCAVCANPIDHSSPVDHDHATGKIRGILCNDCNTGIGLFKDSISIMASAIIYLEKQ